MSARLIRLVSWLVSPERAAASAPARLVVAATRPPEGKPSATVMALATSATDAPAGPLAGAGVGQQRADGALRVGTQRAVHRDALGGERVERGLLAFDLLLGGRFGADAQRDRGVEDQPGDLVRTRRGVGQRDLGAVADADQRQGGHVPEAAQPLDVGGGVRVVVGRGARRDGVGAVRGGGVRRRRRGWRPGRRRSGTAPGRASPDGRGGRGSRSGSTCPMPRRSTATMGWVCSTSAPAPASHTGSCGRRRQVGAGGEDERAGIVGGLVRAGADHTDAQGARTRR